MSAAAPKAYPHVTHSQAASILACTLRGETHESLACLAANLATAMQLIVGVERACVPGSPLWENTMDDARAALAAVVPPTDDGPGSVAALAERGAFDPIDPTDMEDELRERSESIDARRENARDCGYEEFSPGGDREAGAARFLHARLQQDYRDGWDNARLDESNLAGLAP